VTTSSPESEPHVEHTILANGVRQGHTGGLVLSQLHIGLAVGFAIVACLTAFGGGMIVGMWYKASEQSPPVSTSATATPAEPSAQGQESVSQPPEPPPVTFYNTLTNSNMAYAPLTPPATSSPPGSAKGAGASAPAAGTTNGAKAASAGATPARGSATDGAVGSTKAASTSKATPSVTGKTRTAASESHKHTQAPPVAKAVPAETAVSAGGTKAAAQKPAAPTRQAAKETGTPRPAGATATVKAPGAEDSSGQLSAVSGQGLRYRGRVGSYAERTTADQTVQHLTAQEQVPAIVAGRD